MDNSPLGGASNFYFYGSGQGTYDNQLYHTHWGHMVYANGHIQTFRVNVFQDVPELIDNYTFDPIGDLDKY